MRDEISSQCSVFKETKAAGMEVDQILIQNTLTCGGHKSGYSLWQFQSCLNGEGYVRKSIQGQIIKNKIGRI